MLEEVPVVKKVWGEEHIVVNKDYCGKVLNLKRMYRCSLHFHKIKDETFLVSKGEVLMEKNSELYVMRPGDVIHIAPRDTHRFMGIEDSEIIEFSTNHLNEDSYRITESERVTENEYDKLLKLV